MKRNLRIWSFLYALTLLLFGVAACTAIAYGATTLPGGALIVRPAKTEVTMSPGEEKQVMIRVANGTPAPIHVETSFEDVAPNTQRSAVDDPIRLLNGAKGDNSLKDILVTPKQAFDVLSAREMEIPITIHIPKNASPGGRYGAVVFQFAPIAPSGDHPTSVSVQSRIAALFFVRVSGEVKEEGKLVAFGLFNNAKTTPSPTADMPLRMQVAYENTGAVHLDPYGRVTVSSLFGASFVLPIDPWSVLPHATRMREIDMTEALAPGYYTARLELNRGSKDIVDEREVGFWVLPSAQGDLFILLGLCAFIGLLRRSLRLSRNAVT